MIKNKFTIFTFKIKRNLIGLFFFIFILSLLIFSGNSLSASKAGLKLWATSVVPSLLPFFIATEMLSKTAVPKILGKFFSKIMEPLFNISGIGSFAFIMGLISGYPVGAKIAVDFRNNNICTKEECERLLSFTNNSSPLFILGTVGIGFFCNSTIGVLLLITHILSSVTVGIIFRFWKKDSNTPLFYNVGKNDIKLQNITISNLGETLSKSILNSASTIIMIGGFIVLFSVLISIINSSGINIILARLFLPICNFFHTPYEFISSTLTGILEITNGISNISLIKYKYVSLNIILTAFLLGFGGISVLFQVWSIVAKSDLSIKPYILGKLLQGFIASFYTYLMIMVFPFFNFNL